MKLFRKIRQKMLGESKFVKYIIYAIGEIFLVVIGILIAIQINNKNEAKSNKEYVNTYLNKIKQNVNSDIKQFDRLIKEREQTIAYCDSALVYYVKETILNSELFEKCFSSVFIEKQFNINSVAFESLKNSGYMKNLDNLELEDHLNQYYALQEDILFVENKLNSYIQKVEDKLSEKGFYIEYRDAFNPDSMEKVTFTFDSMSKYPNVESSFIRSKLFAIEILDIYSKTSKKGKEIINIINNVN